jgi:hypothetical protein
MSTKQIYSEKLFSYGTLQLESVQLSTFGRQLTGVADILPGYQLSEIRINDSDVVATSNVAVHPIVIPTGNPVDQVKGVVFDISPQELQQADEYEVDDYKRVSVQLQSGVLAWLYIAAEQ